MTGSGSSIIVVIFIGMWSGNRIDIDVVVVEASIVYLLNTTSFSHILVIVNSTHSDGSIS